MSFFVDFVGLNTLVSSSFLTGAYDNVVTSEIFSASVSARAKIVYSNTNPTNGDTITVNDGGINGGIGEYTMTFVNSLSAPHQILIGASVDQTWQAFSAVIQTAQTSYGLKMSAFTETATNIVALTLDVAGDFGNYLTIDFSGNPSVILENDGFGGLRLGKGLVESQSLNAINLHRNGPYNFATFKQIRIHENPLTRYQRRNNLLSFSKRPEQREIRDSNGNIIKISEKFGDLIAFDEPAVVSSYHPLVYNLGHYIGDNKLFIERFGLSFDYSNHITYFTNEELNKLLLLDDLDDEVYEEIKALYLNGALESNASDINYFEFLRYKQDIFPREINRYKHNVRQRTNYENDFWRDLREDRNRTKDLGFGYTREASMWNLDAQTTWSTRSSVPIGTFPPATAEGILQNKFCHFTDDPGGKIDSLLPAPIYNRRHTVGTTASVVAPSGIDIPETASAGVGALFQGDALWEAGEQAEKNPFYSSYDSFIDEMRGTGKEFSIVPEFRISDHVQTLLKGGNLRKLPDVFQINGGSANSNKSNESNFYETYSTTDFLKHFAEIKEDHKNFEQPATITLTCKALKKFLAYDSFYPQDRSVDCAEQFYDSYERYMSYPTNVGNSIQPYLDTLFAPGVLYNTIKSGIAVDYPIIDAGLSIYSDASGTYASGSIDWAALPEAPLEGDEITLSDGGLGNGVGSVTFTFKNIPDPSDPSEVLIDTLGGSPTDRRNNSFVNLFNAVNNYPNLNIEMTTTAGNSYNIKNLYYGPAGNVTITVAFYILAPTFAGMAGGSGDEANYFINNDIFSKRIPFEALVEPEKYLGETSIGTNTVHPFGQFSATASWDGKGDNLYTKMMSNYLAEIPEFFLQGSQLSTIVSEEQGSDNFGVAEFGKTYAMRLKIYKTLEKNTGIFDRINTGGAGEVDNYIGGYIPPQTFEKETITMYSRPTAFGPPGAGYNEPNNQYYYDSRNGINPAFTPPYYDGEAWIDFIWTAPLNNGTSQAGQQTGKFSLSEILSQVTASALRFDNLVLAYQKFGSLLNTVVPNSGPYQLYQTIGSDEIPNSSFFDASYYGQSRSFINVNSMQLFSSINIKQSGRLVSKNLENDTLLNENIQQTIDANKGATNARWVIQTKFETPILNFKDVSLTTASVNLHTAQTPRGMWHQYGVIPENDEGIYLQIQDLPENWRKYKGNNDTAANTGWSLTGSLASLCGFPTNPVKLGQVAQGRVIREAVVAVPYIEESGVKKFFEINGDNFENAKKYFQAVDIVNGGGDPSALGLGNPEYWEERAGASVIDQVRKMRRYVFPPTMDFYNYSEVKPFAMYIFEFNHTLSQQDLADIWQGLPPEIGTTFEVAEDSVSHPLLANQLLGSGEGTDKSRIGEDLNTEIRWMVFKVKQRAKTNYFDKVIGKKAGYGQAATAAGFQTNAQSETAQEEFISYNWPYDFFSLVELVKIDAEVEFSNIPEGKFEPKKTEIPEGVQSFAANLSRRRR